MELAGKRVYVAGHTGMAGSAVVRRLAQENCEVVTAPRAALDLTRQTDVEAFVAKTRPHVVVVAAARVGGIKANMDYPVDYLADNLAIAQNLIAASHNAKVEKLLMLGSTCIYPRLAKQPMSEDQFLTGPFEPTNEWYAVAKAAAALRETIQERYRRDAVTTLLDDASPTGFRLFPARPVPHHPAAPSGFVPSLRAACGRSRKRSRASSLGGPRSKN